MQKYALSLTSEPFNEFFKNKYGVWYYFQIIQK